MVDRKPFQVGDWVAHKEFNREIYIGRCIDSDGSSRLIWLNKETLTLLDVGILRPSGSGLENLVGITPTDEDIVQWTLAYLSE